jgi:sugar lactone lactonase YvrE
MPSRAVPPRLTAVSPRLACPGGLIHIAGHDLFGDDRALPHVTIGATAARVTAASPARLVVAIPDDCPGGDWPVAIDDDDSLDVTIGRILATGVHQVDSPVIDRFGRIYATFSGSRGQQVPVSIFRLGPTPAREPFSSSVLNPTSMAIGPDGSLYVSSRFEGTVSRVSDDGSAVVVVSNVGIACGLAFAPDGALYVGDRSGTIFRANVETGDATVVASLPPSVAAFHLAFGPDGFLYVTGPTLSPTDRVHRVDPSSGRVETVFQGFGRPQGLAFDAQGVLHVADALAGAGGIFRIEEGEARLAVAGMRLVGVAVDGDGGLVAASSDTLYRFDAVSSAS